MRKLLLTVFALLGAAVAGAVGLVFFGIRTQHPQVLAGVRNFNKQVTNPLQMKKAGQPGSSAHIVRHVGRASGTAYETPVTVEPVDGRYVVALPYGTQADWVKNVLAAGSATVVREGETIDLVNPEVVDIATVIDGLPAGEQKMLRSFGVRQAMVLDAAPAA